jgi:hypothetical protein
MKRFVGSWLRLGVALLCAWFPLAAGAQSVGQNGYSAILLDGRSPVGEHFAVSARPDGNSWNGFIYLADSGELFSGSCSTICVPRSRVASGADRGRFVSAAPRSSPLLPPGSPPFAAFYNATSGDLEAVDCLNGDCSFATLRVLETGGDVGAGTATAVDANTGNPQIAYYDATNGDLRLYRCANPACSSGGSVLVDGDGDRGRNPQIAISNGNMTIVYDDTSTGEVRLALAAAPYDSFGRRAFVSGRDATLTLDATGRPDIVYTGPTGALERRRCGNILCLVVETPGALSTAANSGIAPSVTRLANDNLFVTHRDAANDDLLGILCNDVDCTAPTRLTLDAEPGMGELSFALKFASGLPLVLYRDTPGAQIRSAFCTTAACGTIQRRVAGNGINASSPDVALRADGRAVAIWTRLREPRIGLCSDQACSSIAYRDPESANSDGSRPSIIVREDGRPFAFYSFLGGNTAFDCADADCTTGTRRDVGGTGNASGDFTELALRPDGRPVLLYLRRSSNDVVVFDCADVNCSSGSDRVVADELTTMSTNLADFSIAVGADNRPRIAYNVSFQSSPGVFAGAKRLLRCDDPACTSATSRTVSNDQSFFTIPLAIRPDNRPVLIEQLGAARNLVTCADADCSSATRVALPNLFDSTGSMALAGGSIPLFGSGTSNTGGYWQCDDDACAAPLRVLTIQDSVAGRGYSPRLAYITGGEPVLVFGEQDLGDVWLTLKAPPQVFADGFED